MTTISIIGFGSVVKTLVGKVSIIFFMVIVITQIPKHSSKLYQLIGSKSVYARREYKSIDKVPHIVLIGSVTQNALFNFLKEYFHTDHGDDTRHCVIMTQNPDPNAEIDIIKEDFG
mmetsp:Transcript_18829/g.13645  ORF Transcript_18829/g.13645 Transcript_18829/m.13645 type:complete len:116 (-) Transcript_18829:78-425(-)